MFHTLLESLGGFVADPAPILASSSPLFRERLAKVSEGNGIHGKVSIFCEIDPAINITKGQAHLLEERLLHRKSDGPMGFFLPQSLLLTTSLYSI